ncbi:hypothetical protein C2E23DRAFT_858589 [Lenzites betulinus]|nr:hypothetical protein C2E23DRAFT_858589 [Lenzites betulinus]
MSEMNIDPPVQRGTIAEILAGAHIDRQLRSVRAYVVPLRGSVGFRRVPVARFSCGDTAGVDIPILTDIWSVQGVVDEEAIPIAHHTFGGLGRQWDVYNVWYSRPLNPTPITNPYMQHLAGAPAVTGEFVIFRQTANSERLMDVRRLDYRSVEAALTRLIGELIRSDPRWLTEV